MPKKIKVNELDLLEAWAIYHIARGMAEYTSGIDFNEVYPDRTDLALADSLVTRLDQMADATREYRK